MKILLVSTLWGYGGGISQYLVNLVELLHQFGHKSIVMYATKSDKPFEKEVPVCGEYLIPSLGEFPNHNNIKDVEKVLKIIEDEQIDVVYINEIRNYAIIRALNTCRPTIGMVHGCQVTCLRNGLKTFFLTRQICEYKIGFACILHGCFLGRHPKWRFFPKFKNIIKSLHRLEAYRELKKMIAPSHHIKNELIRHDFESEQVPVLPLPYPGETPELRTDNLNYNNNVILFVGRIVREKGVDILLKALTFVKHDFNALIIGDGPYRKKCEHISKRLNLQDKVKFLGWISNDNLQNFYSKATLVVVPSIWPEPYAIVGIEAMTYGRPVVAFDVGGIPDWLENGKTGFLVKRMDYKAMADKITLLLANKSLAKEMGINAYERALVKFNKINYLERLMEIFQSVMLTWQKK